MEKKNTILLTVIAIVTLLVAVVGATFAYYSVQYQNSTSTTIFTGTANPVGAITLTSPVTELHMTITPTDMATNFVQKKFYALATGNDAPSGSTNGIYGTSRKNHEIARATLVGGNTETAYTCTAKINVTTSGTMASVLESGDAVLYLDANHATINSTATSTTLDLSTIKGKTQTYSIVYKVNGLNATNQQAHIYADIELNNSTTKDQSYLAGTLEGNKTRPGSSLTVNITSTDFSCVIDNQKATA